MTLQRTFRNVTSLSGKTFLPPVAAFFLQWHWCNVRILNLECANVQNLTLFWWCVEPDANSGSFYAKLWRRKEMICNFKTTAGVLIDIYGCSGSFYADLWLNAADSGKKINKSKSVVTFGVLPCKWRHGERSYAKNVQRRARGLEKNYWFILFFFKLAKNNFAEELRLYENNETVRIHVQDKFLPPLLTAFVSDGWGQLCKYCTSRGLLQCIYRTLLSFVHLWPFVRSNEFKLPHTLHVDVQYISAMDSSLIYIPAVPRVSSVSCTLVFPEVNVWPENNVLTSSLMHMHFLTFHNALSVVWTLILCTDSDVYTFQTHYVISSPVISIDGKHGQILPVRSFTL